MKPGSELFITTPNWDSTLIQTATKMSWVPPIHKLFFTKQSIKALIEKAEFNNPIVELSWTDPKPFGKFAQAYWIMRRLLGARFGFHSHDIGMWAKVTAN